MSKTRAKATKSKSTQPRFPDGKFFHDVPLFDLDYLKPRKAAKRTSSQPVVAQIAKNRA